MGYLPYYMAPNEFYNLSLRPMLMWLAGYLTDQPFMYVKWLSAGFLLGVVLQCIRQNPLTPQRAIDWGVGLIACYLLVVSPSVFQWYLVWLVALLPLTQSWLTPVCFYWSWSVNLDYLGALPVFTGASQWLRLIEYGPVFLWILAYWWFGLAGTQRLTRGDTINAAS